MVCTALSQWEPWQVTRRLYRPWRSTRLIAIWVSCSFRFSVTHDAVSYRGELLDLTGPKGPLPSHWMKNPTMHFVKSGLTTLVLPLHTLTCWMKFDIGADKPTRIPRGDVEGQCLEILLTDHVPDIYQRPRLLSKPGVGWGELGIRRAVRHRGIWTSILPSVGETPSRTSLPQLSETQNAFRTYQCSLGPVEGEAW